MKPSWEKKEGNGKGGGKKKCVILAYIVYTQTIDVENSKS